jgi:hypothetical protein
MRSLIVGFILCALVSCSTTAGPVLVAKTDSEAIKSTYQDPKLSELSEKYRQTLTDIYKRYQAADIGIYPNGIGFTSLKDLQGNVRYYLLVEVRPRDIVFGQDETKPKERFAEVYQHHFETNLRHMKADDLDMEGIDGLAFAVYWPVRDYSRCGQYGGFIEYATIYFSKEDFVDMTQKTMTLSEAVENAEVITSLGRKPPRAVKVTEVQ